MTKTIKLRTQVRLRSSRKCQGAPRRAKGNPKGAQGRPRGSQRLSKGDQKGIQNGTQNGSRFLSRSRDPIFHKKLIWSMPVQSKSLPKNLSWQWNGKRVFYFGNFRACRPICPKAVQNSPQLCMAHLPTYLSIYLSIHLSSTLAKQAMTAYSHPKVYENTPQGPPK